MPGQDQLSHFNLHREISLELKQVDRGGGTEGGGGNDNSFLSGSSALGRKRVEGREGEWDFLIFYFLVGGWEGVTDVSVLMILMQIVFLVIQCVFEEAFRTV